MFCNSKTKLENFLDFELVSYCFKKSFFILWENGLATSLSFGHKNEIWNKENRGEKGRSFLLSFFPFPFFSFPSLVFMTKDRLVASGRIKLLTVG